MEDVTRHDEFIEKRIDQYDAWLRDKKIAFSSKVIPVSESLRPKQQVLPTARVMEILRGAEAIAVQDCVCRTHYQRCDHPREVCLLLNAVARKLVGKGKARGVGLETAAEILKKANQNGLVHLTLYMPDHEIFALCSCCACCCHDLQMVKRYGRRDLMVRSEYVAVTCGDDCVHCGECVDRCVFGARVIRDGTLAFDIHACLGCGLCVTCCPVGAISMELVEARG